MGDLIRAAGQGDPAGGSPDDVLADGDVVGVAVAVADVAGVVGAGVLVGCVAGVTLGVAERVGDSVCAGVGV